MDRRVTRLAVSFNPGPTDTCVRWRFDVSSLLQGRVGPWCRKSVLLHGMARKQWVWTARLASVVGRGLYEVRHLWYTLLGFNRVKWYQHLRDVAGVAGGLRVEEVTV